jgi:hypothetical protein
MLPGIPVRDFRSAIFSRALYFEHASDIEPWRREIARATLNNQPTLEPPVTEWLASLAYRMVGREDPRLARILTCTFWLVGVITRNGSVAASCAKRVVSFWKCGGSTRSIPIPGLGE